MKDAAAKANFGRRARRYPIDAVQTFYKIGFYKDLVRIGEEGG